MWRARLRRLRESFWFVPAVMGAAAVGLAEVLLLLDRSVLSGSGGPWFVDSLSATGSRALLTTVGGSMLGVAATSFSITISVLATTSSTYGPRLVRNFMADRGNQVVLAVLTSSFVYCLVVLRAVRSEVDGAAAFVPVLAVNAAVLIAAVDVAVLVYFIHHIASSVQVTTLQERVGGELLRAVEAWYPAEDRPGTTRDTGPGGGAAVVVLRAEACGYVEAVELDSLVRRAADRDLLVEVLAMPGAHVVPGEPLARAIPRGAGAAADDAALDRLRRCFSVGTARTPHQDLAFALQQLTEIAVRGLATGTNDPYTAVSALDALGGGLGLLASRPQPAAGLLDADGTLRVVARWPSAADLVQPVLEAVRVYGAGAVSVTSAGLRLGGRVLAASTDPDLDAVVRRELGALVESFERGGPLEADRVVVRDRHTAATALTSGAGAAGRPAT